MLDRKCGISSWIRVSKCGSVHTFTQEKDQWLRTPASVTISGTAKPENPRRSIDGPIAISDCNNSEQLGLNSVSKDTYRPYR